MGVADEAQPALVGQQAVSAKHIVFFDVETNVPGRSCRSYELLEFGAVVLDARGLGELSSYHTLVRPKDLSCIDHRTTACNTITPATLVDAPSFEDVAHDIYQLLHGNIWAGHNILKFDILRINEAFLKIGQPAPQAAGVVDTYPLLRKTFGKRAGNYKLATLANYCGLGKQEHRSISDVRMNIDVLRSISTMLFLESNYPDVFMTEMELTTSTSGLEQSASFSTSYAQNKFFANKHEEQEVDSQFRCANEAADSSSASRPSRQSKRVYSLRVDASPKGRKEIVSGLPYASVDRVKLNASKITGNEEQGDISFSRTAIEDEERVASKPLEASSALRSCHAQGVLATGFEKVCDVASAVDDVDVNSVQVETSINYVDVNKGPSQNQAITNKFLRENLSRNEIEQDLSHALFALSIERNSLDKVAYDYHISKAEPSLMPEVSKSGSITEFEGLPFLLASHVNLSSIEVRNDTSSYGSSRTLYYNGFPLHLLESKIRVRFTIKPSYAFDDKGKPRFSILVEPSETACNIIKKCEDLIKSMIATNSDMEWLPAMREEFGGRAVRLRIETKLTESTAVYATEFFRATVDGLEKISLGHVDASTFRNVLPHGSIIDTGFGFYVFDVNNRTGVRLLAKHITVY